MPYRDLPPQSFWKSCRDGDGFPLGLGGEGERAGHAAQRLHQRGTCSDGVGPREGVAAQHDHRAVGRHVAGGAEGRGRQVGEHADPPRPLPLDDVDGMLAFASLAHEHRLSGDGVHQQHLGVARAVVVANRPHRGLQGARPRAGVGLEHGDQGHVVAPRPVVADVADHQALAVPGDVFPVDARGFDRPGSQGAPVGGQGIEGRRVPAVVVGVQHARITPAGHQPRGFREPFGGHRAGHLGAALRAVGPGGAGAERQGPRHDRHGSHTSGMARASKVMNSSRPRTISKENITLAASL